MIPGGIARENRYVASIAAVEAVIAHTALKRIVSVATIEGIVTCQALQEIVRMNT